jgi:hypothetical protein
MTEVIAFYSWLCWVQVYLMNNRLAGSKVYLQPVAVVLQTKVCEGFCGSRGTISTTAFYS